MARQGTGWLSTQVLQEFYVNVTRKLAKPLDATEAQALLSDCSPQAAAQSCTVQS